MGYERALPGVAERIVKMAEEEASHHREMECSREESGAKLEARGHVFGFILAASTLVGGMVLLGLDKAVSETASVIAAVAGLAGLFAWSRARLRKRRSPTRNDKASSTRAKRIREGARLETS